MSKSKILITSIAILALLFIGINLSSKIFDKEEHLIVAYYSEDCGCCEDYVEKLKMLEGVKIATILNRTEWLNIRSRYSIPDEYLGCHSMLIDSKHFVEGHLQIEIVKQLLEFEKPLLLSNPDYEDSSNYYLITASEIKKCEIAEKLSECVSSG